MLQSIRLHSIVLIPVCSMTWFAAAVWIVTHR